MTIGIIGAGAIGSALARQLARGPRRHPQQQSRPRLARGPGPRPQPHHHGGDWNGRIVIDTTNPLDAPDYELAELGGRTSSEIVADLVPGARLVKAFNTLKPALVAGDPREGGGRRVTFYAGDNASAKAAVGRLIERLGFFGIDLGTLARGGRLAQFPGGPLATHNLVKLG